MPQLLHNASIIEQCPNCQAMPQLSGNAPTGRAGPSPGRARPLALAAAWHLVSKGPAQVLGLTDRGDLAPGQRADLVILDSASRQVAATFSGGRISYMAGAAAERFLS